MRSTQLGETLLPKKIALPVFASDALSSVAYATEEILLVLSAGGLALIHLTWYAAAGVAFLMLVVVASYRQNVHAYPSGGGDYEVATTNLGRPAGITVAAALMVDYVLTVAVSVSSGVANISSAVTSLQGHEVRLAIGIVAIITLLNLRGLRESGTAFAVPTYAFMFGVAALIAVGVAKIGTGRHLHASSEHLHYTNASHFAGFALLFLLLRAFASGCTALTGVEAISNGVPAFKKPKEKNAATTLALLGGIAVSMFLAITTFAIVSHVHTAPNPTSLGLPGDAHPPTVIAQVGAAIFGGYHSIGFYYLQAVTALILVLAANTAFNGFPVLASILARDGFLPRQLHTRGDRLAFSNGILLLAGFAMLLIFAFSASPTRLIQLYIVGVFVSFVNSQTGMIRHWNRHLPGETDPARRRQMKRSRIINSIGAVVTSLVLVIILISKFTEGAWIAVVAMAVLFLLMRGIRRHYDKVRIELAPTDEAQTLPSRVHAVVLVSKVHKATLRAVAYARATRPSTLEAVTVDVDPSDTTTLQNEWDSRSIPVPLKILESPYREVTKPILDYVRSIRRQSPRDLVTVFIPEYVVGHWWEQLLHNQSALRLKGRLLFTPGIMVVSVPYQLASSGRRAGDDEGPTAGDVRRGRPDKLTGS
ncbi:MAG TPA: APC family permease [Mycobacteriales bacterium]|nr:APC family permease [Mycobacteriales bacterium]